MCLVFSLSPGILDCQLRCSKKFCSFSGLHSCIMVWPSKCSCVKWPGSACCVCVCRNVLCHFAVVPGLELHTCSSPG